MAGDNPGLDLAGDRTLATLLVDAKSWLTDHNQPVASAVSGRRAWGWWPMWLVTTLCFGAYLGLSLGRWRRQVVPSWDLAIFEQAVKGWADGGVPVIDIRGPGVNQLGDHFSPLLALLAPIYRLFPSPVTLLVVQCVLVAISITPVMALARRWLGGVAAVLLGLADGVSWGFQSGVDVQFHEYALAVPLLAFGLWALLSRRWVTTAVLAGLLLGVKEDLGLTVIVIGVLMLTWGRRASPGPAGGTRRQTVAGVVTAGVGVVATPLILFVVIPAFNASGTWGYWAGLTADGDSAGATGAGVALANLPHLMLTLLTPATKVNTLVLLVALTLGCGLMSRLALLALPTLLWRFLSPNPAYWGTGWHYSMILMPIMFMAAIDALRRLSRSPSRPLRTYARLVPVVACAFGLATCLVFPLKSVVSPAGYAPAPWAGQAAAVLALIPASTTVATDTGLMAQLVAQHTVYWLGPLPGGVAPDYLLIDPRSGWSADPGDPAKLGESYYPGTSFTTIYDQSTSGDPQGYRLAERDR